MCRTDDVGEKFDFARPQAVGCCGCANSGGANRVEIIRGLEDGPFGKMFTFKDPEGYLVTVHNRVRKQRYCCLLCRRSFTDRTGTPFTHHRWHQDVIVMAVRWYFNYRLSVANVRNLLADRGFNVSRQTVADWAQKFSALLAEVGRWHAESLGRRWFVDETYLQAGKTWTYL